MKATKKNTLCFIMLQFICITGFGQFNVDWTKYMTGIHVNSVLETSDSGYIVAASIYSEIEGHQAYLLKMNFGGDTVWSSHFGSGQGQVASQTLDNGYIVGTSSYGLVKTNSFGDTLWTNDSITIFGMTFKPTFSDFILPTYDSGFVTYIIDNTNPGGGIHCFIKLDKSGNPLQLFPGYTIPTSDSGYISKREYSDSTEFIRMNSAFDTLWIEKYACGVNYFFEDWDGSLIATGYQTSAGDDDNILLIKLDADGGLVWSKTYNLGGYEESYCVRPTLDKGYVVCGYTEPNDGSYNYYALVIKTDSDGDAILTKTDTINKHSWTVYCHQALDSSIVVATKTSSNEIYFEKISFNNIEIKNVDTSIHKGETYFAETEFQTETGTYFDTISDISGNDSIVIITNLQVYRTDSQIPNGDMENWTLYNRDGHLFYDPDSGWFTNNKDLVQYCILTAEPLLYPYPCGDYAIRLKNIYTILDTVPGTLLRFPGFGEIFPINERYSTLNYYAAFLPENGDTATIGVLMYKNGSVIGMSEHHITEALEEWTPISQDITYLDSETVPDSMGIGFFAYRYIEGQPYYPRGESELYIDNISLDGFMDNCQSNHKYFLALTTDSLSNMTDEPSYVFSTKIKDIITEIDYLTVQNDTITLVGQRKLCGNFTQEHEPAFPININVNDTITNMVEGGSRVVVSSLDSIVIPIGVFEAYTLDFYNIENNSYTGTWIMATDIGRIAGKMFFNNELISYVLDTFYISGGSGYFPMAVGNNYYYQPGMYEVKNNNPHIKINIDTAICQGANIYLQNAYQSIAGTYTDTIYGLTADTVINTELSFYSLPQVDLGKDTTIQAPDTLVLDAGTGFSSYLWSTTDVTQTINIYSAIESATERDYIVVVTDLNSCRTSDTITISFQQIIHISKIESTDEITVYPNPFHNNIELRIKTNSENEIYIQLLSIDGKLIYKKTLKNSCNINTEKLPSGTYLLKIKNNDYEEVIKMVKMH